MEGFLREFADVNDAVAISGSKLRKQKIFAEYLRNLADDDLRRAIWYAAGRAFAATDERVLGASGAIVSDVLILLLKIDAHEYYQRCLRAGEVGEAIAPIWPRREGAGLTLADLADAFEELARVGRPENKRQILSELFERCAAGREAAYLAKIIFGDMRTGMQGGVLQAAVAETFAKPQAAIRRAELMIGDLGEVAVRARRDELESIRFALFHPIQFMLATPQESPEIAEKTLAGRPFFAEDKLDGIRAQVHKSGDRIAIYTRTMDRTEDAFPDVVESLRPIAGEFVIDGELVPFRDGMVLPFAHIQRRLGRKLLSPQVLRENPAAFIAFDVLYLNGELLIDLPLRDRNDILKSIDGLIALPHEEVTDVAQIEAAFSASRHRRNEGVVLKDPESVYSPGRRGQAWLKLKTHLPTLDCVITAAEYGNGKRRNSLSDYTFAVWDEDHLVNIGKAYIGVTDQEIAQLTETLLPLSRGQYGRVHLVEPRIVLEVACDSIQRSDRHASGFALRFPRIKRIRWDKRPDDADTLARVREIFKSPENFAHGGHEMTENAPEPTLFDEFR